MTLGAWLLISLGLAVALALWFWRPRSDFQIKLSRGSVKFQGKFPPHRKADTTNFLLQDLALTDRLRIVGTWTNRHVLRVDVHGAPESQQRIRNFLKSTLGG